MKKDLAFFFIVFILIFSMVACKRKSTIIIDTGLFTNIEVICKEKESPETKDKPFVFVDCEKINVFSKVKDNKDKKDNNDKDREELTTPLEFYKKKSIVFGQRLEGKNDVFFVLKDEELGILAFGVKIGVNTEYLFIVESIHLKDFKEVFLGSKNDFFVFDILNEEKVSFSVKKRVLFGEKFLSFRFRASLYEIKITPFIVDAINRLTFR